MVEHLVLVVEQLDAQRARAVLGHALGPEGALDAREVPVRFEHRVDGRDRLERRRVVEVQQQLARLALDLDGAAIRTFSTTVPVR